MRLDESRKQLRLTQWNYKSTGYYLVTLCVEGRQCLFGNIENGLMCLNEIGEMIDRACKMLPMVYSGIGLDCHIVMPNHLHAIIVIEDNGLVSINSLFDIIRKFKTYTMHLYRHGVEEMGWMQYDKRLWQRSYHEHIIRNEYSLEKIREYIINNPIKWELDSENPKNKKS